ncbi:tyrosine-protein phosphatase 10D [Scaptodrosophila lebanonensis]|uniref:Tyrosine-protein phosphatase 10D n=1 Tax=Drosophila lebanonensis TaxID=7225 RepID=A0A6J2TG32_DROLE|nr:tyrosine-protein phosphatase 10D [Scaptodrosophila lebanonensis]
MYIAHLSRWFYGLIILMYVILAQLVRSDDQIGDDQIIVVATAYTLSFTLKDEQTYQFDKILCRNRNGNDIIANEQNVCDNLDPCSTYTSIITLTREGVLLPDKSIESKTEYKEPTTEITSVECTENSITLKWQTTDGMCIEYFGISATSSDNSYSTQQLRDSPYTYTFENLNSCQNFDLNIKTTDVLSVVVGNDSKAATTKYSEPGDLTLSISNQSNGDTRITWPDVQHKTCINIYKFVWRRDNCDEGTTTLVPLRYRKTDDTGNTIVPNVPNESTVECEWMETSQDGSLKQFTLMNLQGCELHTFEVFINDNQTAKSSESFISAEKTPSAITNPTNIIAATELFWQWEEPSSNAKCVANYKVNLTGPAQRLQFNTTQKLANDLFVVFEDLDPCGSYEIQIVPISLNGTNGPSYQNTVVLNEDQPSEIWNAFWISEPLSIELHWDTPKYGDLCIDSYRTVGWLDENITVDALSRTTKENTVLFDTGLSSCQSYTIQIIPYTVQKLDGLPIQMEIETKAAIVDSKKIDLQLVSRSSHGLKLNARNQDNDNSCQTYFAYFNCSTLTNVPYKTAERYVESHTQSLGFQATLGPLSPDVAYTCDVILHNMAGASKSKRILDQRTQGYFPEKPQNLEVLNRTSNSLYFRWREPIYSNGQIRFYIVYLMLYKPAYFVPSNCPIIDGKMKDPIPLNNLETSFDSLFPAIEYSMQVAAQNDYGLGQYTAPLIAETLPGVSDPVSDLNITISGPNPYSNAYSANATVFWNMPCKSNGVIEAFQVKFRGERNSSQPTYFMRSVPPDTSGGGRMSYTETMLQPEYNYTVSVAVKTLDVDELSEGEYKTFEAPAGIPARLSEDVIGHMRVNAYETNHPTSSAIVRLPIDIMSSDAGTIKYIALLLSQKSCASVMDLQNDTLDSNQNWPPVRPWEAADQDGDCICQYQTTPVRWEPNISTAGSQEITYTIGIGKCPDESEPFCNGPLKADTEYHLVVRLFTKSGYNDAALLEFKTDAAIKVTLILVSVCCCLLLAFVVGLLVLWVRKRIAWHRDSGQGIEDPFGNVTPKNFAIFYNEVSKPEKLAREFKEITVVAQLSYAASELGCHKNRYADIYPYDKNRVILDIDSECSGSDYINASFIDGHTRKKEYIATQGPKPETIMDFWRMILQYNVRVIVQVTQFREGNSIKCHEYFPYTMRGLNVRVKSKESFELYERTELSVVHDLYGLKQKVIHFYFKKWPDHGCPENPLHLITFLRKVKAEKRPNYSPIVVHCSAGVGRTGTFIGLDLIMQRLKSESKINIFETVKKLRFQRMKMVQTQQQYTFLYSCTFELVKHKIPRIALKSEGRAKHTITPITGKKVSFPDSDALNNIVPDPSDAEPGKTFERSEMEANAPPPLPFSSPFAGIRKGNAPESLHHPKHTKDG